VRRAAINLTPLTIVGLFTVTAMLVFYSLEKRSLWFALALHFLVCKDRHMLSCRAQFIWAGVAERRLVAGLLSEEQVNIWPTKFRSVLLV
jgi:hypothetical protein